MDYKKYSEELETIIAAINLPEHTRILVDGDVEITPDKFLPMYSTIWLTDAYIKLEPKS